MPGTLQGVGCARGPGAGFPVQPGPGLSPEAGGQRRAVHSLTGADRREVANRPASPTAAGLQCPVAGATWSHAERRSQGFSLDHSMEARNQGPHSVPVLSVCIRSKHPLSNAEDRFTGKTKPQFPVSGGLRS